MEASKKKKIIIVSSLLVIGGIVGYLLWKQNKDKEDALTNTDEKNPILDTSVDLSTTTPTTTTNNNSSPTEKPTDITAFQKFAKSKGAYLGTSGPNKDGVDGSWGGKTSAAWATWGADYNKMLKAGTTQITTPKGSMVKLVDVLASGITKANNKTLFASIEGLKIYNLQGQVAWKTKKGEILGAIRSATNTGRVNFRATNGVDYYTSANGMLVKM